MDGSPLVIADHARAEQFRLLGTGRRLFHDYEFWTDAEGIAWAGQRHGAHAFCFTWLGQGWVFDSHAVEWRADRLAAQQQKMEKASDARHQRKLAKVLQQLRLGGHAERLLWVIHQGVLGAKSSVIRLPDRFLASAVWGRDPAAWPAHWRKDLLSILQGLGWLHVTDWPDEGYPLLGRDTALLTHVADLRRLANDNCAAECLGHGGPRHHHFLINVGRGFLGVLEQFAQDDESGIRSYDFPIGGPKTPGPSLWRVGKTGQLVTIFLPAKLGEPSACAVFTHSQHRLLQALVRETTRAKKRRRKSLSEPEVFAGNLVPAFHGRKMKPCSLLDQAGEYVGFTGNGKRKGLGYRLTTLLTKAGYPVTEVAAYLTDLVALAGPLGLIVVGIGRDCQFVDLKQMQGLTATPAKQRTLERLHVRVYTKADYQERWTAYFHGQDAAAQPLNDVVASVLADMKEKKLSRRMLAVGIEADHSFVSKVLSGNKPWPKGLLETAQGWIAAQGQPESARLAVSAHAGKTARFRDNSVLTVALDLLDQGWCVLPQLPGAKKPCVKWKQYQEELPAKELMIEWIERWPAAGLVLVLGPVSGIFVSDVDGAEAHAALIERLVKIPPAPKVLSGSGKPHRYHLFFRHPNLPTKAKQTPWHEHLEFRGKGGIVVIPPSLHKSGKRYVWAPGRSPAEIALPEVPQEILDALKPATPLPPSLRTAARRRKAIQGIDASPRTLAFLSGEWADGPRWNDRLFNAACDLHGREMALSEAEPLLLAGAQPWNHGEDESARKTILSAFSQLREPARL